MFDKRPTSMFKRLKIIALFTPFVLSLGFAIPTYGERPPLTKNVPVWEFQNAGQSSRYDVDSPPKGLFQQIEFSRGYEQELTDRRTHEIVAVDPTEVFQPDARAVFLVFKLHQHYEPFKVIGVCFPENIEGLDPSTIVTEDSMMISLEDDSGYLQFFPPPSGWKPGKYRVEIHVGWEANEVSKMGTMRFRVSS